MEGLVILVLAGFLAILAARSLRIIRPFEKGVVETLGKWSAPPATQDWPSSCPSSRPW